MSNETNTPMYKAIFELYRETPVAERRRSSLALNSFPLSNITAFPLIVGTYFDGECETTTALTTNHAEPFKSLTPSDYVVSLSMTATSGKLQSRVTTQNTSSTYDLSGGVVYDFTYNVPTDALAIEFAEYLVGTAKTPAGTAGLGEKLVIVQILGGESPSVVEASDVVDLLSGVVTTDAYSVVLTGGRGISFAADMGDGETARGEFLFMSDAAAEKAFADMEQEDESPE